MKIREEVVGARGFEPPTPWSRTRCATRLRYAPTEWWKLETPALAVPAEVFHTHLITPLSFFVEWT